MPSASEWGAQQKLGLMWPTGSPSEHEVQASQATRKEFCWRQMSEEEKALKLLNGAWAVWGRDAIEALSPDESVLARKEIGTEPGCRNLTACYVFTDRHESLRTSRNPLPVKAWARIIAPGYKDIIAYGEKDALLVPEFLNNSFLSTLPASPRSPWIRSCTGA